MKANSFKELGILLGGLGTAEGKREAKSSVPDNMEVVNAATGSVQKVGKTRKPMKPKEPKRVMFYDSWGNPVVKELAEDEEYVILEDGWYEPPVPDNLLEPAPSRPEMFNPEGNLFLIAAATKQSVLGLSYGNPKNYNRLPPINHSNYIAQIAKGCIVVMGGNAYRSLLNRGVSNIPGVILAVLSKEEGLVLDAAVTQFTNIEELGNHIRAAKAVGQKVFINSGPKLLKYFESDADGLWLLTADFDKEIRATKAVYDFPKGKTIVLCKDAPIAGISKKPVTLEYRAF